MKRFVSLAAAVAVLGVFAAGCTVPEEPTATSEAHAANVTKKGKKQQKASEPTETVAQENARGSAEDYLDMGGFSRTGLIKQLKFEGFSKADATYAVDAVDANWKVEAAQAANDYMDTGSFSRSALLDQLEFEGFTPAQAAHGVSKVGY